MNNASDKLLFERIERATAGGRALLCTLGRLGKSFRGRHPERAETILLAGQAHPLYKGGRLLFDLLELEDLMLDGPQPDPVDSQALTASLRSTVSAFAGLTRVLTKFAKEVSQRPEAEAAMPRMRSASSEAAEQEEDPLLQALPQLDSSEYLYDLVVLGIFSELAKLTAADEAARLTSIHREKSTQESSGETPVRDPE